MHNITFKNKQMAYYPDILYKDIFADNFNWLPDKDKRQLWSEYVLFTSWINVLFHFALWEIESCFTCLSILQKNNLIARVPGVLLNQNNCCLSVSLQFALQQEISRVEPASSPSRQEVLMELLLSLLLSVTQPVRHQSGWKILDTA